MVTARIQQFRVTNPADEPAEIAGEFDSFQPDVCEMTADPVVSWCSRVGRPFAHRVAIHESGHATVGRMLGMPVAGSTINRVGDHIGSTWSDEGGLQPCTDTVESLCAALAPMMPGIGDDRSDIAVELLRAHHHVLELLAGREAERIVVGTMLPRTEHDLEEATAIAGLICRSPASVGAYLAFAKAEVVALLHGHRAAVLAIADALIKHRSIDGSEIARLINNQELFTRSVIV
jgi:hypothetical protein